MKLQFSLLFLIIFVCNSVIGQNDKYVDSLFAEYEKENKIEMQIPLLAKISEFYMYNNTLEAKKIAESIITLSTQDDYGFGITTGFFLKGNCYAALQKMDSAIFFYNKTLKTAARFKTNNCVASALANISVIEGQNGNYAKAIKLMDSVAIINIKEKDYLNYGVTLNNRAYHFYEQGDYLNAMKGFQAALNVLDTINRDIYRKADVLRNIGKLNYQEKSYPKSIEYFTKALNIYNELDDFLYQSYCLVDIGNVYMGKKDFKKAIEFFNKSIKISRKYGFNENLVNALSNIGVVQRELKQYKQALNSLKSIKRIENYDVSITNSVISLYQTGYTYALLNNKTLAINNLNKAVKISDSLNLKKELINALSLRSKTFEKFKNYEKALNDNLEMIKIKDSLFSLQKNNQINQLQVIYETEKKEAEIALQNEEIKTLNIQAKNDKLTKTLYASGMFSFLTIAGLIYFGFRQRIKKNEIEREKQEAILKQEIEFKKKELASQTLHLVQKSTFLQELKENLEKIKKSPELFKIEFRRLVMLLKKESAEDKDWEVFKSYFSEVHNNFDNKLKNLSQDITEKEIRLASFLRMNLSTKEIASMLNVLPESVLKSKYRLKKKLNLNKETDLNAFLNTM
ncbi:tetratricopeptide repeat protein [uncultured Algibacter sp.]|uniref:tetratricopeptide repeat protein n=1 Tax=uncultured Algibacter sp. TaxID=298659 RepID=UPI00261D56C0|nr:tetratricopeptide repeat protein [uncultured Algibacter sp.]